MAVVTTIATLIIHAYNFKMGFFKRLIDFNKTVQLKVFSKKKMQLIPQSPK